MDKDKRKFFRWRQRFCIDDDDKEKETMGLTAAKQIYGSPFPSRGFFVGKASISLMEKE